MNDSKFVWVSGPCSGYRAAAIRASFSVQVGGGWFAATPENGPDWRLRLNFVVLIPEAKALKAGLEK